MANREPSEGAALSVSGSQSPFQSRITAWIADACNPYPDPVDPPSRFHDAIVQKASRREEEHCSDCGGVGEFADPAVWGELRETFESAAGDDH